jgi:hypothetical protein
MGDPYSVLSEKKICDSQIGYFGSGEFIKFEVFCFFLSIEIWGRLPWAFDKKRRRPWDAKQGGGD